MVFEIHEAVCKGDGKEDSIPLFYVGRCQMCFKRPSPVPSSFTHLDDYLHCVFPTCMRDSITRKPMSRKCSEVFISYIRKLFETYYYIQIVMKYLFVKLIPEKKGNHFSKDSVPCGADIATESTHIPTCYYFCKTSSTKSNQYKTTFLTV